jgi:branched-chain amino acid transport system permease protein
MSEVSQYIFNGLMLGVIYAMVAVGFTLFFGVLDVIKFSHGDTLMVGAFAGLTASVVMLNIGLTSPFLQLLAVVVFAVAVTGLLGASIAKFLILPLRHAPPLNTLLATLMLGTVLREAVRLFYPDGSNPKPFPALLPSSTVDLGELTLRVDNLILLASGLLAIAGVHFLITRTKLGMAIRAVAQDGETARLMGINFEAVVLITFALGSGLAALAGVMNGLYYSEVNFSVGLLLGVIGFAAAILGGLGNIYGAIIGGFIFAALQVIGSAMLPALIPNISSSYSDVFAFAVVIIFMAWKPTGLIAEKSSERV